MILDCGGMTYQAESKEKILEMINEHFELINKKEGFKYTHLEKKYFKEDFTISKSAAIYELEKQNNWLKSCVVGCIVKAKLSWFAKWGNNKVKFEKIQLFELD